MMQERKSKKILIYFFLLIAISSINNISLNNFKFEKIKNIYVSGLSDDENKVILEKIKNLNLKNILIVNKKKIIETINSNTLVENYNVKKKYPSSLEIKIVKTKLLAKINVDKEIFIIGSNGKLSLIENKNVDLPFIFGKPEVDEFLKFKKIIDESKLSYYQIDNFYFFPSKRWDLKLKNNILIKLPKDFTKEALANANKFIENYKSNKFTIVDLRVNNQIILNE